MIVDYRAAEIVKLIFDLAESGLGSIAIGKELKKREIIVPSVYKYLKGDSRFSHYSTVMYERPFDWCDATISQILNNRVYLGELTSLKTEVVNYKTKKRVAVPRENQIVIPNAHEAIITEAQFERVQSIRAKHPCPTNRKRDNIFRGKLFCECCSHPLVLSKKQLKDRTADMYFCMYHYSHPEVCPQTHRIYHEMLYPYVLDQIRNFAKVMKKRKINSPLKNYTTIDEITPEILDHVIERIEIGHVTKKSKPGSVIHIYWKV